MLRALRPAHPVQRSRVRIVRAGVVHRKRVYKGLKKTPSQCLLSLREGKCMHRMHAHSYLAREGEVTLVPDLIPKRPSNTPPNPCRGLLLRSLRQAAYGVGACRLLVTCSTLTLSLDAPIHFVRKSAVLLRCWMGRCLVETNQKKRE